MLAWITGANGLIGNYLVQAAPRFASRWRVRALTRDQLDLLDFAAVRPLLHLEADQELLHAHVGGLAAPADDADWEEGVV